MPRKTKDGRILVGMNVELPKAVERIGTLITLDYEDGDKEIYKAVRVRGTIDVTAWRRIA